ncbi:MAG: FG-GAP-like repeat-containing protein [Myxococcota bacterium]
MTRFPLLLLLAACSGPADEPAPADTDTVVPCEPVVWALDADGDGFGDADGGRGGCAARAGEVAGATDCDDADATVHPDAVESCETPGDDDCDGDTNEQDAVGCTWWYRDEDGDTYGTTSKECFCEPYHSWSADNNDDCDDENLTVYPGAVDLAWGNGVEYDCVRGTAGVADADATLTGVAPDDFTGWEVAGAGDVDADGYDDLLIGAPHMAETFRAGTFGTTYLVRGPVEGTVSLASAEAVFTLEAWHQYAGLSLASAGDVNGDGFADVLIGAITGDAADAGAAYLLHGPITGPLGPTDADATWSGGTTLDRAGAAVAGGEDLDGDGLDDFVVGAPKSAEGGDSSGAVYVASGPLTGTHSLPTATTTLVGEDDADWAGSGLAVASDINGDGVADVLVAASGRGVVYVLYGPLGGRIDLSAADAMLTGAASAVDVAGDIDGDGLDDILAGTTPPRTGGVAYLVLGAPRGVWALADTADAVFNGDRDEGIEEVGEAIAGAGDVDGDGTDDLLFGAPVTSDDGDLRGAAFLVYGPVTGTVRLDRADETFFGNGVNAFAGYAVAAAGDTNGDDFADFLVGSPCDDPGGNSSGSASLFLGR